jgi:hypothetical protein
LIYCWKDGHTTRLKIADFAGIEIFTGLAARAIQMIYIYKKSHKITRKISSFLQKKKIKSLKIK